MLRALTLLLALCFASCSAWKNKVPKAAPVKFPAAVQDAGVRQPVVVGIIRMVNEEAQFVVVEGDSLDLITTGTELKCMRNGVVCGAVKIGPERKRQFLTADITAGPLHAGDQVVR